MYSLFSVSKIGLKINSVRGCQVDERLLFVCVDGNADVKLVTKVDSTLDDIKMATAGRVKGTGVDGASLLMLDSSRE